jgi:arylsulfatase A-like enzyme
VKIAQIATASKWRNFIG